MTTVHQDLSSQAADKALIAQLQAQLAAAQTRNKLTLKVSGKGAVSLYGVGGKFPATYYGEQWLRILDHAETIRAFIKASGDAKLLAVKGQPDSPQLVAHAKTVAAANAARDAAKA